VKHGAWLVDPCVGGRNIEIGTLLPLCEGSQGGCESIFAACSSPDLATESNLDLETKEEKGDAGRRGAIVLRLRAIDTAEAGIIAICNAQLDIERVEPAVDFVDCAVVKASEAIGDAGPVISDLSNALEKLVTKLEVFMRIADEIAKVNRFFGSVIYLTDPSPRSIRMRTLPGK